MYEGALKFISGMFVCFRFSTYQTTSLCLFTQHSLPLVIKKRSESVYMRRFTPVFFSRERFVQLQERAVTKRRDVFEVGPSRRPREVTRRKT